MSRKDPSPHPPVVRYSILSDVELVCSSVTKLVLLASTYKIAIYWLTVSFR